jgi:hypothetical protein
MAIDIRKLGLGSLVRDEVMDVRRKARFPEDLTGNHKEAVLAYEYLPAEKGKGKKGADISARFQVKVRILESDNERAPGREHTLCFWLGGEHQKYSDRDRLGFIAACAGESVDAFIEGLTPEQANEKLLDIQQQLLDSSEKQELGKKEDGSYEVVIYHTRTCKQKERAVLKDGKAEVEKYLVANDYFNPVQS